MFRLLLVPLDRFRPVQEAFPLPLSIAIPCGVKEQRYLAMIAIPVLLHCPA